MRGSRKAATRDECTGVHQNVGKCGSRATKCATKDAEGIRSKLPADLAIVVGAWDKLPEAVKAGMVAMVSAAIGNASK